MTQRTTASLMLCCVLAVFINFWLLVAASIYIVQSESWNMTYRTGSGIQDYILLMLFSVRMSSDLPGMQERGWSVYKSLSIMHSILCMTPPAWITDCIWQSSYLIDWDDLASLSVPEALWPQHTNLHGMNLDQRTLCKAGTGEISFLRQRQRRKELQLVIHFWMLRHLKQWQLALQTWCGKFCLPDNCG